MALPRRDLSRMLRSSMRFEQENSWTVIAIATRQNGSCDMAKKRTRNFGDVIRKKLAANPALARAVEEESFNANIAQQVYDLRTGAKLTQKQLAELVGTQQSVISRIEDADYQGHSLTMLKRIALAL